MHEKLVRFLIAPFPPDSIFRVIGKRFCSRLSVKQKFYTGVIYFDAVLHSWAFKGGTFESFDTQLKDELLSLSKGRRCFIDLGCNIGQMTLSVLLRNDSIKSVSVDPNARILRHLKKSVRANHLENRAAIIHAAVGNENGYVHFTEVVSTMSEMGHITPSGKRVRCISFAGLVNEHCSEPCLVKMDVEGFESTLLKSLGQIRNLHNVCLMVELHLLGYNEGNPRECLKLLQQSGARLRRLDGLEVADIKDDKSTQVIAQWDQ